MCTPTAYFVFTALSAAASIKGQNDQANYEHGVAQYNARVSENTAQAIRNKATQDENIQRQRTAEIVAKQRAQLGAANVDLNSGSAFQLITDTKTLGEADALRIRTNADNQYQAQMQQGTLDAAAGDNALIAGRNAQIGTALTTGFKMAGTAVDQGWYKPNSSANTRKPPIG